MSRDFLTLAKERYSSRKYSAEPVAPSLVEAILEAARVAPSARNLQPTHVWVVRSAEAMERLGKATKCLFGAPVVFVVGYKPSEAWTRRYDGHNQGETDAAIVGTHIMMAAADLGLGSCWVGAFDPAVLAAEFPEFEGWTVEALFPVGHAADAPSERHGLRKAAVEFVSEI